MEYCGELRTALPFSHIRLQTRLDGPSPGFLPTERKCSGPPNVGCEVASELVELSAVIADIYDAAIEPALWKRALASVCNFVGGKMAALLWHDTAAQQAQVMHIFNDDPHYTKLYFEKYLTMDPFFPAAGLIEAGLVHVQDEIVPRDELVQTRFYKEWIAPQGIVDATAVNLEVGITRFSMINIRSDSSFGPFDRSKRDRLALLVPHLQRAVSIGKLFDQNKATTQGLTSALDRVEAAVFLVGAEGVISFANDAGKAMLDDATLVRARDNVLHAVVSDTDRILHDIFHSAAKGDASVGVRGVAVPLGGAAQERWFAHVMPLTSGRRQAAAEASNAVAAIFIRKTAPNAPPPLEAIAKLYRLTATELRVLDTLLRVNGVRAMAGTLGLSQATVKTHLHNLFRKTGAARQSDLVKLVAGI
jgi:DNA-binding CsgD family transcriptional regulator